MWQKRSEDIVLKETPSGEMFSVLVGRHESTGASTQQTVALVELPIKSSSDPHFHKEREESYYFLNGEGKAVINKKEIPVKAGDLIFAHTGESHEFINLGSEPLRYLVFTSPQWHPSDSFKC